MQPAAGLSGETSAFALPIAFGVRFIYSWNVVTWDRGYVRRRRQLRKEWIKEALYTARGRAGGCDLRTLAENPILWKKTMNTAHSR